MTQKNNAVTSPVCLLFLKAPRPGTVKTRLAEALGDERACEIYRGMVERLLRIWPDHLPLEIHFSPPEAEAEMQAWLGSSICLIPQSKGDLGKRLGHAVQGCFEREATSVLCIGGDCPDLSATQLDRAIRHLDHGSDLVLGPAEDGGYYLIGLKAPQLDLFQDIPWSSPQTFKATVERAKRMDLNTALLEPLYDVDTVEDWERAVAEGALP